MTGGLVPGLAENPDRSLGDVLEGGHVGEEVEALEDHADRGALPGHLGFLQLVEGVALLAVADDGAVDGDPPAVDLLQVVDAAQEGGFARAGRAEDHHHLAAAHVQVDALEHLEAAKALVHPFGEDHRVSFVAHRPCLSGGSGEEPGVPARPSATSE